MASLKYILPALAIAGGAAAASCSADTTTLQSQADATGLSSCSTFSGSIAIATGTTDAIALSGVREITGSLIASNVSNLPSLSSTDLETIGDTFSLQDLTILSSLNFPRLTSANKVDWNGLKGLGGLSFTSGLQMVSSLSIQNTYLASLQGINLQKADVVNIANNPFLGDVTMQLGNVSQELSLNANGRNVTANFPNLIWANEVLINNVSSFSVPSLAAVNGSMRFNSDYFSIISAPNLTTVGKELSFIACPQLTNISMPQLQTITGGLTIINNTALQSITGFGSLATISGALNYQGNFTNATLPSLKSVVGAFNIQSTGNITDACNHFQSIAGSNNIIQGPFDCTVTSTPNGGTVDGSSTGTTSGSSPSSTKNAANTIPLSAATGLLGVVAAIFGML